MADSIDDRLRAAAARVAAKHNVPLRAAPPIPPSYDISADGRSITCRLCRKTSHHPRDAAERYCGFCRLFHDDMAELGRR